MTDDDERDEAANARLRARQRLWRAIDDEAWEIYADLKRELELRRAERDALAAKLDVAREALRAAHTGIWHRVHSDQNPNYQGTLDLIDAALAATSQDSPSTP